MRVRLLSIPVMDQEKAFQFYTTKLGFIKKHDVDMGNGNRWLTLISPEDPDGPEILLEPAPLHFEPSKVYQEKIFEAGMPWTQLDSADVQKEYEELESRGVQFKMKPTDAGTSIIAMFDDTCGNYIMMVQTK